MFNKYPAEFEEMFQRLVVEKEDLHNIIQDYKSLMKKEDINTIGLMHHLGNYIDKIDY
ncbi:MAG: hypothetical protein M1416_00320 [Candidatus Pacearchaeota archaeon]|nr:hypothetical protein [Candidatus Pacearchaeota archaeon]